MISMQQLEELESRVVKALQLIGDLRTENSKLENENEEIKGELEEAKLTLEEKEQEVEKIRKELDEATRELEELNAKEEVLEKKVIGLLGKLDTLAPGGTIPAGVKVKIEKKSFDTAKPASLRETPKRAPRPIEDEDTIILDESIDDFREEDVKVETVKKSETVNMDEDEDIIIIDDEGDLSKKGSDGVALETVREKDDDIILLDEKDEEIIIEDVDHDTIIIDEEERAPRGKGKAKSKNDDDDFLIIEDDK
jgi:DNA repair exonuclease SbcCD ATPase subunit